MVNRLSENLIQIAGVIDATEARMLCEAGVGYLGFPLRLAFHPEDLSETEAAQIIRGLAPPHTGVLITYLGRADEIVAFCRQLGVHVVQLHGDVPIAELGALRRQAPELVVIKSLVVGRDQPAALDSLIDATHRLVDAYITDTYDPVTGATGATGLTHDWSIDRRVVQRSPRPVILAGGLTPANVHRAIVEVRPAGVDAHTGVEGADGRKDPDAVRAFVAAAQAAFEGVQARGT